MAGVELLCCCPMEVLGSVVLDLAGAPAGVTDALMSIDGFGVLLKIGIS